MSELEVLGLVKRFRHGLAVDQVSFQAKEQERFALLGPAGSGKTTLLRMLCGLEKVDAGRILLDGHDVTALPPSQRKIGALLQNYGLYPPLNVYDNITFGLASQGLSADARERRVRAVAEPLQLEQHFQQQIEHLSQRDRLRVALARALVKRRGIYLYDEPLANMSEQLHDQARQDIQTALRLSKATSIYCTREPIDAFALADRIAVLSKGKLQQVGTAEELTRSPSNMFVASFLSIPAMNLIPGFPQLLGSQFRILAGPISAVLPPRWTNVLIRAQLSEVVLGIRPGAIFPVWDIDLGKRPASAFLFTHATIVSSEHLPWKAELVARLQLGANCQLTATFYGAHNHLLQSGQSITIGIHLEDLCVFDPRTQQALVPSLF